MLHVAMHGYMSANKPSHVLVHKGAAQSARWSARTSAQKGALVDCTRVPAKVRKAPGRLCGQEWPQRCPQKCPAGCVPTKVPTKPRTSCQGKIASKGAHKSACKGEVFCAFHLRALVFGEMWAPFYASGVRTHAWHRQGRHFLWVGTCILLGLVHHFTVHFHLCNEGTFF